jgi:23S rRNA (guanine745-N1)-methyltransferase
MMRGLMEFAELPTSALSCPVCAQPLADAGASARCAAGHSFDYARSGYLNLVAGGRESGRVGDTAAMVQARAEFLAAGHFEPVADAVAAAAAESPQLDPVVAEIGSGTGYYLGAVVKRLNTLPECSTEVDRAATAGFGFELSKAAAAHAGRAFPALRFVVADVEERVPLLDATADLALSVFAPRPAAELARVLRPGGELLVAMATPRHLAALRERLGLLEVGEAKLARLEQRLRPAFEPVGSETVEYEIELSPEDVERLVAMGPNAWHEARAQERSPLVAQRATNDVWHDLVSVEVARFRRLP